MKMKILIINSNIRNNNHNCNDHNDQSNNNTDNDHNNSIDNNIDNSSSISIIVMIIDIRNIIKICII